MNTFSLTLFVTGRTSRSEQAIANLQKLCEDSLSGEYNLTIVDVLEEPERAEEHKILATPTLVKEFPTPTRRIIGDLSDVEKVAWGLGLSLNPEQRKEDER
jgi:circadian clock protein KaiB